MPRYWVSFDLGLRGNYDDLYAWLDSQQAKECGESVATFESDKSRDEITAEIKKIVSPGARVYLISRKEGGRFIMGKRRPASWAGYAVTELESDVER